MNCIFIAWWITIASNTIHHALLQWLWETKSLLFCYRPLDQNWNRKGNYWIDCPTGSEKLSAWGLGLALGTPMAPCIILAWGRFGNRLPISTSTWLSHPPPSPGPPTWFSFLLLHLLLLQTRHACYFPRMATINRKKKKICTVQRVWQELKMCNHTVLFPTTMGLIVDTSRGENVFHSGVLVETKNPQNIYVWCCENTSYWCAVWAKRHSGKVILD